MSAEMLLTPAEIAERWKCSAKTVSRMIDSGALRAVNIAPRITRVRMEAIRLIEAGLTNKEIGRRLTRTGE